MKYILAQEDIHLAYKNLSPPSRNSETMLFLFVASKKAIKGGGD